MIAGILVVATLLNAPAEKFRNDRVVIIEDRLAPGEARSVPGSAPSVTVYFDAGTLEVTPAGGSPHAVAARRGEALFQPAGARNIKNTGASPLSYVRIDLLGKASGETWGAAGLSPNYKVLLENRYARVYDIRIPAGTTEPQHTHRDRVVVCLSGAKLRHRMPDGREEPSTLETGEVAWRRAGTHIGQNLGNTDLWVIAIEPK